MKLVLASATLTVKSIPAFLRISLRLGDFDARTNFIFYPLVS